MNQRVATTIRVRVVQIGCQLLCYILSKANTTATVQWWANCFTRFPARVWVSSEIRPDPHQLTKRALCVCFLRCGVWIKPNPAKCRGSLVAKNTVGASCVGSKSCCGTPPLWI